MSEEILRRSKIICYFTIDDSLAQDIPQLMAPEIIPISVYHFHYPAIYFPILHKHLQVYLPATVTPNHLRLVHKGRELPVDLPIGLFVDNFDTLSVTYSKLPCPDGFKLMMISWKKGYTIVNREGGCDHVFKKLNLQSQMQLYQLHQKGKSHGLNKIPKYQGNAIALRIFISGAIIQQKFDNLEMPVKQYLQNLFGQEFIAKKEPSILTHNIEIDLNLPLKTLLEEWNYNDGYCYLKIV